MIAGILLAVLLLLEIAGQLMGKSPLPPDPAFTIAREWCYPDQIQKDHELLWRYRPNQVIRGGFLPAGEYTINSRGYRTPEFTDQKPEGVMRVVCMGGSSTFGWGVSDGDAYPRRLEEKLNEFDPENRRWEVVNLGVTNYSSRQGLRLARSILDKLSPDLVLIHYSWADHQPAADDKPDIDIVMPSPGWVTFENTLNRSALMRWIRSSWRRTVSGPPEASSGSTAWRVPPSEYSTNIEMICRITRQSGGRPVVVTSPVSWPPSGFSDQTGIFHYHHRYRRMARYGATLAASEFVELANAFDEHSEFFLGAKSGDFEHFDARGHAFAGEFLARYVISKLTGSVDAENPGP
jgi:lysophospholipase L1-like esterase